MVFIISSPDEKTSKLIFVLLLIEIILLARNSEAADLNKISTLLICFCSFYLCCPKLEKDNFIEIFYLVLSCLIKLCSSFLTLFVSI